MAAPGDVAAAVRTPADRRAGLRVRAAKLGETAVALASIAAALVVWELISRAGLIDTRDLSQMTATFQELWRMMGPSQFWSAFLDTVRGWALGLGVAAVLAI